MNLLVILRDFSVADGEDNENTRAEARLMVLASFGLLEDY